MLVQCLSALTPNSKSYIPIKLNIYQKSMLEDYSLQ